MKLKDKSFEFETKIEELNEKLKQEKEVNVLYFDIIFPNDFENIDSWVRETHNSISIRVKYVRISIRTK